MRNVDFTPLYRSAIGFDRLFDMMESNNAKNAKSTSNGYPPYNIEQKDENNYRITMAVAGFSDDQINITQKENLLIITAESKNNEDADKNYIYQGIAERDFERKFQLADYIKVLNATMKNGLLHIDLERETPDVIQPRTIAISHK